MLAAAVVAAAVVVALPTTAAADTATGTGTAAIKTVDVRTLAAHAQPRVARPTLTVRSTASAQPSAPSTGSRAARSSHASTPGGPNAAGKASGVSPLVAPGIVANFDGLDEATACGSCQPANPNVGLGQAEIMQTVNLRLFVTDKTGVEVCDIDLFQFFTGVDTITDPHVLYDNVNQRWLIAASVVAANSDATPAMWVGATTNDEACGIWNLARITFSGNAFPNGTTLSAPIFGQDRNALLVSTDNITPSSENFTVFGVPKTGLYNATSFSFTAFGTASRTAPVSNAGIPMISTSFSYFLGAVPGTGYRLYRLSNSGGSGATLTLLGTVSASFSAPTRRVNQPGTSVTLDPSDGRIASAPMNDGSFIWFTHVINDSGFPTVRYGAINISSGSATLAEAFHSNTSDDFNPSIGIGNNPGGGNFIFVNWAYTDSPNGVATSMTVDSVTPHNGVPDLVGTGNILVNGSRTTTESAFGRYSSVGIDPTASAGSCAVATQQYFVSAGTWRTRIARLGSC
jgi:hypothetical protein